MSREALIPARRHLRFPLHFRDHPRFHHAVIRGVVAGGLAGGAAALVGAIAGPINLFVPVVIGISMAVSAKAWWPMLIGSTVTGAFAGVLAGFMGGPTPLAAAAVGAVLGLLAARHHAPKEGLKAWAASILGCGATTALGVAVINRLIAHGFFETLLPAPLPAIAYGASLGLFVLLGTSFDHFRSASDPVLALFRRVRVELSGELLDLAERGVQVYVKAKQALHSQREAPEVQDKMQGQLSGLATRVLELASQVHKVDDALGEQDEFALAEKLQTLVSRAEAAADDTTRHHYLQARRNLEAQADQLQRIHTGRERVVASLHGQIALLERTQVSLVGLASSDSSRRASELGSLSEVLSDAAREMEAESEAVLDVDSPMLPSPDY